MCPSLCRGLLGSDEREAEEDSGNRIDRGCALQVLESLLEILSRSHDSVARIGLRRHQQRSQPQHGDDVCLPNHPAYKTPRVRQTLVAALVNSS
jgi:hypothetical protein